MRKSKRLKKNTKPPIATKAYSFPARTLLKNIRAVQTANNIKYSTELAAGLGAVSLDVEMETGTGKTYVYIKTMFELHKAYGWSKFIVVVPSIAIREGVKKSFEMLEDHFMQLYGLKARHFVYNSATCISSTSFLRTAVST
jgi:type III restriction enzyme